MTGQHPLAHLRGEMLHQAHRRATEDLHRSRRQIAVVHRVGQRIARARRRERNLRLQLHLEVAALHPLLFIDAVRCAKLQPSNKDEIARHHRLPQQTDCGAI